MIREAPHTEPQAEPQIEQPYTLYVICAWCGRDLGTKPTSDPETAGKTSHGMCAECVRRVLAGRP